MDFELNVSESAAPIFHIFRCDLLPISAPIIEFCGVMALLVVHAINKQQYSHFMKIV